MAKFYSFNFDYEVQKREYWCWCACLLWIIKKFKTAEYKEQWQILLYYEQVIKGNELLNESDESKIMEDDSFNVLVRTDNNHVNLLIEELIRWDYEEINILEKGESRYKTINEIFNFQNLKKILDENNAPIIVVTYSHMRLISGYGVNECGNYILVSDPYSDYKERFVIIDKFINSIKNEIFKVWILNNPDGVKLEKDIIINRTLKKFDPINQILKEKNQTFLNKEIDPLLSSLAFEINDQILMYPGDKYDELNLIINQIVSNAYGRGFCNSIIPRYDNNVSFLEALIAEFLEEGKINDSLKSIRLNFLKNRQTSNLEFINKAGKLYAKFDEEVMSFSNFKNRIY